MSDITIRPVFPIIAAVLIAAGLAGAGWFAAKGMERLKTADRYVTVKEIGRAHV